MTENEIKAQLARANANAILESLRLRQEVAQHKQAEADSRKNSDEVQARIKALLGK